MRLPLRMGDGFRQWLVALGVVVLFASLFGNFWQGHQNAVTQASYGASANRKDREIFNLLDQLKAETAELKAATAEHSQTLAEIATVQQQVANLVMGLEQGAQVSAAVINTALADLKALCNADGATCATFVVPVPRSSSTQSRPPPPVTTTTTTTTTTTAPKHGGHGARSRR